MGNRPSFVDIFAGCGGLSLGLLQAGWEGLFAIEKDGFAFETLSTNLLRLGARYRFSWPSWLPQEPMSISSLMSAHLGSLEALAGAVDLLVGGPPCQGYSSAGRRDPSDPRNRLFASYIELVELLKPKLVLLENVRGMTTDFYDTDDPSGRVNYAARLVSALSTGYLVSTRMLNLSAFGVPQNRLRFFLIGIRRDLGDGLVTGLDPFDAIEQGRLAFLRSKGVMAPVTAKAAISDFEIGRNGTAPSPDSDGFQAIAYREPITPYQRLMRDGLEEAPSDTRLANHRPEIINRFREIITSCHADGRLNVSLGREAREAYGLKKRAIRVLDPDRPAPTVTSMPDDLLHYSEPRTLTVRENARLQSFPDWFVFRGKYTSGSFLRRLEVPRFTQVANAVPPLAAEAIGRSLLGYVASTDHSWNAPRLSVQLQAKDVRQGQERVPVLD